MLLKSIRQKKRFKKNVYLLKYECLGLIWVHLKNQRFEVWCPKNTCLENLGTFHLSITKIQQQQLRQFNP